MGEPPAPVPRLYGQANDPRSKGCGRSSPRWKTSKAIADFTSTLESEREGHGNHLAATAALGDQSRVSQSTNPKLQKMVAQLVETKAELDE